MATDAANKIPTTVLPATLVEVPATATYELKKYSCLVNGGREGDVESVELHRNGKMVAMANNRGDGGMCSIEIWSRGDDEMFARERKILHGWIADFKASGLVHRIESPTDAYEPMETEYDEEAVANVLLFEAKVAQDLSRKRTPYFAESMEKARKGVYFTLKNSSKATPAQLQGFLDKNPGVVVWSKAEKKWTSKIA